MPAFVTTRTGFRLAARCADSPEAVRDLDVHREYLIASRVDGTPVHTAPGNAPPSTARLPMRSANDPG